MNLSKKFNKLRREIYKTLSDLSLKSAKTDYFGLKLKVPLLHGLGAGFLVPADQWMSDSLKVFLEQKEGTVVDIGVNIGLYMVKLRALDRSREYIGFEPNAICNYYTHELIRANKFNNVRVLPFALSDKKELRSFYVKRRADKMGSLNDYARFGDTKKFSFDLFTFPADEFFEMLSPESLCAVKIDVEGSELEVLRGLVDTIKRYRPYLFCEIWQIPKVDHPTYQEKYKRLVQICELLKSIDYKILGVSTSQSKIDVLDSVEQFGGEYRRDYILVHESEESQLREALTQILY
ncbi:FkbM family methyltransferase [Aliikangiella coralliicola]|uniref:FkbM family methyltransferase n=1 Tax=Aliikangiella coralliicola TaxID=2592383 RepID=A0A545UFG7_9GAMM|nr:FkbM family methyltransferase [Aliikangiella coralliicola]TQV88208.1 FkbM family methyltransferase [Aliikangiella coralliicola]